MTEATKLEEAQGVDKNFGAARTAPAELGINHAQYLHGDNLQKLPVYAGESLMREAIDDG